MAPLEQVAIMGPGIDIVAVPYSLATDKLSLLLDDLLPYGYGPLFDATGVRYVTRTSLFDQVATQWGSTAGGQVGWGIDPGGRYCKESGFPEAERTWMQNGKRFNILGIGPGWPKENVRDHWPPLGYRPGDRIVFAPNACNVPAMQIFPVVNVLRAEGDYTLGPNVAFTSWLTRAQKDPTPYLFRVRIPLSKGGSEIRVHFAGKDVGLTVQQASIGIQQGAGWDTVAPLVPLAFNGGSATLSLPPTRADVYCDWRGLVTTPGCAVIVCLSLTGPRTYEKAVGDQSWFWNGSVWQLQDQVRHAIDCVEVR